MDIKKLGNFILKTNENVKEEKDRYLIFIDTFMTLECLCIQKIKSETEKSFILDFTVSMSQEYWLSSYRRIFSKREPYKVTSDVELCKTLFEENLKSEANVDKAKKVHKQCIRDLWEKI